MFKGVTVSQSGNVMTTVSIASGWPTSSCLPFSASHFLLPLSSLPLLSLLIPYLQFNVPGPMSLNLRSLLDNSVAVFHAAYLLAICQQCRDQYRAKQSHCLKTLSSGKKDLTTGWTLESNGDWTPPSQYKVMLLQSIFVSFVNPLWQCWVLFGVNADLGW